MNPRKFVEAIERAMQCRTNEPRVTVRELTPEEMQRLFGKKERGALAPSESGESVFPVV